MSCQCCKKMFVVKEGEQWFCFFCSLQNETTWRCLKCHNILLETQVREFQKHTDMIYPGILLGDETSRLASLEVLQHLKITHILCLTFPENFYLIHPEIEYLHIPILDQESQNLLPHIKQCIDFINSGKPNNVLIHCRAGVSRSASIVIAWLIMEKGMTYEEACNLTEKQRPVIAPNEGFVAQLKLLSSSLFD